jgi:signal transduction histidine kinase
MDRGFRAGMEDLLGHLLEVFQASKVLIVARDRNAGITYQYELRLSHHLLSRELNDADSASWFVDAGAPTFSVRRVAGGFTCGTLMDGRVHRGELKPGCDLPQGWATALVASFELPDWHGRLYVVNPGPEPRETVALRLLHSICEQALPAMHNLYLVGRLRSRSIAVERARLARELHDGPVQSLLGIRLQLEALRRSPETSNSASTQLGEVQELLKSEVVGLRELQERLRPVAVGPENLAASLTRAAEKFEQNTGIRALCSFEAQQIDLTPSACYELYRIAEEALINVRKHSRASEVRISLVSFGSRLMLQVSDNGKGMPFEGRLALAEMERTHAGPVVIRERVRAIGGELIVRSKPGEGTQILVEVARRAAAASAAHA